MSDAQHPHADHPAALILADHYIARTNPVRTSTAPIGCACDWAGPTCDHPAHLAEMLDQAGLLAPPPVVTVEEAAEGDPGMEATQAWFRNGGC